VNSLAVENERQLLSCFDEVLDAPASERLALVRSRFGADEKLVHDLEQLLAAAERTDTTCLADGVDVVLQPVLTDLAHHSVTQAEIPTALVQTLAPRYTILERIGRGGMALVYLAFDSTLGRHVAIKSMRPELADGIGLERFAREIAIAATVDHPRIVPVYDRGDADGLLYYVMRYVEGGSLRDLLLERPQLEIRKAIDIARDVAEALDAAHAKKVVHRDIKPANILLDERGAHVADFGVAALIDAAGPERLTRSGIALGTALYMSPEQAGSATKVDGRSDVYALACVLYEMLAGEAPFNGPSQRDIVAKHLAAAIPDLTVVRATISRPMQQVIATALQKSPADRFATAGEFIDAFERAYLAPDDAPSRFGTATEAIDALDASLKKGDAVRWRRVILGLLAASIVLIPLAFLRPGGELDSFRVLVLPVENHGSTPLSGEDLATALVDALNSTDSLIASVGQVGDSTARLPWTDSLLTRLGRSRNSRYVVTGRITPDASTRLEIQVHDLTKGSTLFRELPVRGDAFSIARQVARALLPDLIRAGGAAVDEGLLSENVPALAAYLQGERAYRRSDYHAADSLFGAAVLRDSSFAWAALRGAQAANWLTERKRASEFVAVAMERVSSLPPRYASFARGLSAYGLGQADSAVAHFRQSLSFDHRWAEAHMSLGEVYQHYLPSAGYPLEIAAAEFDSALTYDPGFSAPLFHATQHAIWKGNRSRADSLFRRFSGFVSGSPGERQQLELMRRCLDAGSASAAWKAATRRSMNTAAQAATWVVVGGLHHPGCATDALEALVSDESSEWIWRHYARLELASVQAALGNVDEVRRLLLLQTGVSADVMTVLLATSGVPITDLADSALGRLRERHDATNADLSLWAAGTWLIERGEARAVSSLLKELSLLATEPDARRPRLLQASLQARLTLARGDTAGAIVLLERLVPNADQASLRWSPWEALPWERFRLAQLLAARGETVKAAQVAAAFDSPASFGYVPWLPVSLQLRERLERSLGDAPYADALRRRFLGLKKGTQG